MCLYSERRFRTTVPLGEGRDDVTPCNVLESHQRKLLQPNSILGGKKKKKTLPPSIVLADVQIINIKVTQ